MTTPAFKPFSDDQLDVREVERIGKRTEQQDRSNANQPFVQGSFGTVFNQRGTITTAAASTATSGSIAFSHFDFQASPPAGASSPQVLNMLSAAPSLSPLTGNPAADSGLPILLPFLSSTQQTLISLGMLFNNPTDDLTGLGAIQTNLGIYSGKSDKPAWPDRLLYQSVTNAWGVLSATPINAGSGYAVGDTITLDLPTPGPGEIPSISAVLKVATVTNGAVATVTVSQDGSYCSASQPTNPRLQLSTSGTGTGATFNVTWWKPSVTMIDSPSGIAGFGSLFYLFHLCNFTLQANTLYWLCVLTTSSLRPYAVQSSALFPFFGFDGIGNGGSPETTSPAPVPGWAPFPNQTLNTLPATFQGLQNSTNIYVTWNLFVGAASAVNIGSQIRSYFTAVPAFMGVIDDGHTHVPAGLPGLH